MRLFRLLFYMLLIGVFLLSIVPHPKSGVVESGGSFAQEIKAIGKLAYIGEEELSYSDKYRHFVAFWVLALLFDLGYFFDALYKFVFLGLYGIAIELIQALVPYRECDIIDIIWNLLAVGSYYFVTRVLFGKRLGRWYQNYQRSIVG